MALQHSLISASRKGVSEALTAQGEKDIAREIRKAETAARDAVAGIVPILGGTRA